MLQIGSKYNNSLIRVERLARASAPPARTVREGRLRNVGRRSLRPLRICQICGTNIKKSHTNCASCAVGVSREGLIEAAKLGRVATHSREAEALRDKTQRLHTAAIRAWRLSDQPAWLNEEAYRTKIQPALAGITVPAIVTRLGVSEPYATDIRAGKRVPHPRHWEKLAEIVSLSEEMSSQ